MPCFCPSQTQNLSGLLPKTSLNVSAVPPQMGHLIGLLGLTDGATSTGRADLQMNAMLPSMTGQAWLHSTMSAAMPGLPYYAVPSLMNMTARMSAVGHSFPMHDPRAVLADLKRTLRSMAAHLLPFSASARSMSGAQLSNMVLAARMTLGLRAKGLCPMALANVDMSFSNNQNLGDAHATFNAAVSSSMSLGAQPFPSFGLSLPKLNLAMSLAALAPLADAPQTLGLPPVSDPDFSAGAMNLLSGLGRIPALPFDITRLVADLMRLSDLTAIHQAFGSDAMSPAGISRVRSMLSFFARLSLPRLPSASLTLQPQLDMLPSIDAVRTGAQVARSGAATFAMSTRFNPSLPVILPFLSALDALKSVLTDTFGTMPSSACSMCRFAA